MLHDYTLRQNKRKTLRKKCPYSGFFWSVFSCIRTENIDQKNSKYGHFSCSDS